MFGEVVAEYVTAVAGAVTGRRSDAMAEPGDPLAFILFHRATPQRGGSYPE
jgi:predicted deacylase